MSYHKKIHWSFSQQFNQSSSFINNFTRIWISNINPTININYLEKQFESTYPSFKYIRNTFYMLLKLQRNSNSLKRKMRKLRTYAEDAWKNIKLKQQWLWKSLHLKLQGTKPFLKISSNKLTLFIQIMNLWKKYYKSLVEI